MTKSHFLFLDLIIFYLIIFSIKNRKYPFTNLNIFLTTVAITKNIKKYSHAIVTCMTIFF
jgi:hypothetical protein